MSESIFEQLFRFCHWELKSTEEPKSTSDVIWVKEESQWPGVQTKLAKAKQKTKCTQLCLHYFLRGSKKCLAVTRIDLREQKRGGRHNVKQMGPGVNQGA